MAYKVARVGSVTKKGDKVVTGASKMYTDPGGGGSVSIRVNGQVVVYDDLDLGSVNDDPETDDGLIHPPGGDPYAPDPSRGGPGGSGGTPMDEATEVNNDKAPLPTDCAGISGTVPYSYQLSTNFKLSDVSKNAALSRQAIVAQQGLTVGQIICNLKALSVNCLEPLATRYGRSSMIITSGFRAGSGGSQHQKGQAADIQFAGISDNEYWQRALWVKDNIAYDQFILEYLGNRPWFHLSFSRDRQRKQVLTAVSHGNYQPGLKKMR